MAHHTLQDIIKIIMPEGAPHVISHSRSSLIFQWCLHMLASMLEAFCTHPVRSKLRQFHPSASLFPYGCDTFSTHYTDSRVNTKRQEAVSINQLVLLTMDVSILVFWLLYWNPLGFDVILSSDIRRRARKIASPTSRGYCVFQSGYQNVSPPCPTGYLKYRALTQCSL